MEAHLTQRQQQPRQQRSVSRTSVAVADVIAVGVAAVDGDGGVLPDGQIS